MIVVVAALKGGVGKTTTAVYLAAVASANRRAVTVVDADPQASSADWLESTEDERLQKVDVVEAPTDRLLLKALGRVPDDDVAIVDTPPGHERLLAKAMERASGVVVPTRVGGVETPRANAVLDLVPGNLASTRVAERLGLVRRGAFDDEHDLWVRPRAEVRGGPAPLPGPPSGEV